MIQTLPQPTIDLINHYLNLELGDKRVKTPYYMNLARAKDLRAMVGKGLPHEIEMEANIWAKIKGLDFNVASEQEIRKFLMNKSIGVDCSGFVAHLLNTIYKEKKGRSIWRKLRVPGKGFWSRISYLLRPVEQLGANILTGPLNSDPVAIKDVRPGDLIRSKWKRDNSHHVMMVYEVEKDEHNRVKEITYVNSTEQYGDNNGVRFGKIKIKDQDKPLQDQEWVDADGSGVNHQYEGFLFQVEDNGLRRIRAL